jgi:hypothetical protein
MRMNHGWLAVTARIVSIDSHRSSVLRGIVDVVLTAKINGKVVSSHVVRDSLIQYDLKDATKATRRH